MPTTPELIWPLPCIVCGRRPEPVFASPFNEDEPNWQPYAATTFITNGQYGSTVFDGDGGRLMANICDHCMREKAHAGLIAHVTPRRPQREPADYEAWLPDETEDDDDAAMAQG